MDLDLETPEGGRLAARRRPGPGAAVVLVHGSGGGLHSWDAVIRHLPADLDLWTYARRGHPPSDGTSSAGSLATEVTDLAAVVDAVGVPVHLVGGSFGATVALHAAADARRLPLRTVSLFEPPLFAAGPDLGPVLTRYRQLLAGHRTAEAGWLFAAEVARVPVDLLGPRPDRGDDDGASSATAAASLRDLEAMVGDGPAPTRWDVGVPVLLLQGELTWAPMPATMDDLAARLAPPPTRAVLAGHSHFATHTAPQLVAEQLVRFLASG